MGTYFALSCACLLFGPSRFDVGSILQQNTAQTPMTTPVLMSESDLPDIGLTTSSVFTIRSSISIDAPKQKVWDVLLDFASYREWRVDPYFLTTIGY